MNSITDLVFDLGTDLIELKDKIVKIDEKIGKTLAREPRVGDLVLLSDKSNELEDCVGVIVKDTGGYIPYEVVFLTRKAEIKRGRFGGKDLIVVSGV